MTAWLEQFSWLGNSGVAWITALIGVVIGYLVVYGVAKFVARYCRRLSEAHPGNASLEILATTAASTRGWIILLLAAVIALRSLHVSAAIAQGLNWLIVALIGVQVAMWVSASLIGWLKHAAPGDNRHKISPIIFTIITWMVELLVWTTLLLILLSQAGVHIGAFIASLGVGGIAIALAAKNVLEDLFASLAIGLDKPFEQGEFIAFGSELGTVKKVGIKSTRIESLSGEEMAINNSKLLQMLVHNYSRRAERRIVFGFHLPLDTPRGKVEAVTRVVNGIIDSQENVRRDRGHFIAIEPLGFRYEFVYYMLTPDYGPYCDTQQAINLGIMAELEGMGLAFAMPARMNYESTPRQVDTLGTPATA